MQKKLVYNEEVLITIVSASIISSPHLGTFSQLSNGDQVDQHITTGFQSESELKQLFMLVGKSFDAFQVS